MNSLAPRDAAVYWLSARTRNDLFLLYCFADTGAAPAELRRAVAARAAGIPDLLVHVLDTPANIAYPIWAPCEFMDDQFTDHPLPDDTWVNVTAALGNLLGTGVRAQDRPWRLHVFRGVRDAPGFAPDAPALVAVLQLSHALADGRRASALARALFTETAPEPAASSRAPSASRLRATLAALPDLPIGLARTIARGLSAYRAEQRLAELTTAGAIPPATPGAAPNLLNGDGHTPSGHAVRMLVNEAERLRVPGHTVTVVVLTAVSLALQRYLAQRAEPAESLLAQVPMSIAEAGHTRNSYRDLSIDLSVREPVLPHRAARIAANLAAARQRAAHPLQDVRAHANDDLPAPLLHRDVTHYPIDSLPERVSGHTVVSSVHRGPADLTFGGGRVHFTAGFPALGSVMHLTHGVHGLGDTVTVSVHADPAVLPDLDAYAGLLDSALSEAASALRTTTERAKAPAD
ncbi:WS/DGAT domain-containing protein [Nocardia crassostreae]|uniref:WS/DGAT domain-containing protein n=1 Tax=Nocardia crassostreae TaxID=53428 RepID=UPI0008304FA0|nr:WS/DGAT domain-containing protein [Nocardia crassostreae]